MTSSPFISTTRLKSRRDKLKKEKNKRELQSFFRRTSLMFFAGGTFWLLTLPNWVIRNQQQIEVQGNKLLSVEEVRSLIPLEYPQSLIQLSTNDLANQLQARIPLTKAIVSRELIPPRLTVTIEEKPPVAIAYGKVFSEENQTLTTDKIGYLDENGVFVTGTMYSQLAENPEAQPQLKIWGVPEMYLPYWEEFYHLLIQSPIPISEVDWQNPTNIILTTDLGKVHLGAYSSQFPQQLMLLGKLKPLTAQIRREDIIYIDLNDPEMPMIKRKQTEKSTGQ